MLVHRAYGITCSSYRAEMMAIKQTLVTVLLNVDQELEFDRILWIITDSHVTVSHQLLTTGPNSCPSTFKDYCKRQINAGTAI